MHGMYKIIFVLLIVIMLSSCATINMFRTRDVKESDLISAHKYRNQNEGEISVGMSKEEVINLWGAPSHIYKPDIKNEYNYYSDEFWIYTQGKIEGISYEVYFKENRVTKIIELDWNERFVGLQDLR